MSWPDPVEHAPADDYTREHRALYERIRREAMQPPVPDEDPRVYATGPTAAIAIEDGARWRAYLHPAGARARRQRRPAA